MGFPEAAANRSKMITQNTSAHNFPENISWQPVAAVADCPDGFKSADIFDAIKQGLDMDGPTWVKKIQGIYCFKVTNGPGGKDGMWIVDAKNDGGKVSYNENIKADCTITMKDEDLADLMMGKLDPQRAFFQGKLKISGNMGLALKLQQFTQKMPKSKL